MAGGVRTSPPFPAADPIPASTVRLPMSHLLCGPGLPRKLSRLRREGETIFLPEKQSEMTLHPAPELLPAPHLPLPHGRSSSSGSRRDNSLICLSRRDAVHWIHQERGKQKEAGGEQAAGRNK